MSGFKALQDVSNNFENYLQHVSKELYSAKIKSSFDERVLEKTQQIVLFSAKLKLLQAKSCTLTSQKTENLDYTNTITEYTEEAALKIIEQLAVKSVTQSHAVKALITNNRLEPEQIKKKEQIIKALLEYREKELQLRQLESNVKLKRAEHDTVREEWDRECGELLVMRNGSHFEEELDTDNPIYMRLSTTVTKLEMMRQILGKLMTSRGRRDWLNGPLNVCEVLRLTRTPNTIEMFLDS